MVCQACSLRSKCSKSSQPRRLRRWEHADRIEMMTKLLESKPDSMVIRKQTVEPPFGTIKLWMGATHLLTRRFKGGSIEMDLHVLAYNMKRMISIFGVSGWSYPPKVDTLTMRLDFPRSSGQVFIPLKLFQTRQD